MAIYIGRDEEEIEEQHRILDKLLLRLSLHERAAVELLSVEAPFEEWVEHLGIANLPTTEQHRKVNGGKARIKKKLRHLALRWGV